MRMNDYCKNCLLGKNIDAFPASLSPGEAVEYKNALLSILEDEDPDLTAPEASSRIRALKKALWGEQPRDYYEIKRHFNALMLRFVPDLEEDILYAGDPLVRALQYAMTGNFIDFAAFDSVEESKLMELLGKAREIPIDPSVLEKLRQQLLGARKLTYITDNCGEIVMDKLLLRQILRMNPSVEITVLLRGGRVVNDACMEDAEQIGLPDMDPRVRCLANGTALDGTVLRRISREAKDAITLADLTIAKGQGNYETLSGCGYNLFYLFMCKCELFMKRFGVPQFSGILAREIPE
ncbi:MAG: DUF89 family protein [Lachnospiraceae bacterium]|nr:DUF89 family protein [Lachnospiraceae bacterium]